MKNIKNVLLVIVFILLITIVIVILNKTNSNKQMTNEKYYLTSDYNTFYTVEGCANKYYDYLSNKNLDNLMKLIDNDYIKDNGIDKSNVLLKLNNYSSENIFIRANKMFQNDSGNIFYLKGVLYSQTFNKNQKLTDGYLVIKYDLSNNLFSVIPITADDFNEVANGRA